MAEIKEILDKIKEKKALAETSIDEIADHRTRNVKIGHIKRAKEDLKDLYREYRKALQEKAVFIVVTGSSSKKFAESASKDYDCFSIDADSFYEGLIENVNKQLYNERPASPQLFDIIMSNFNYRALEIDIIGYRMLIFESKYKRKLKDKDDFLKLTKQAFNEKIGSEVVGLDATDRVAHEAVNRNYEGGKIVPIILHTKDESLAKDLIKGSGDSKGLSEISTNVFLITAGKTKDEKLKENALISVKSAAKTNVEKSLLKVKENI